MAPSINVAAEIETLKAEIEERNLKIEALSQFEYEFGLKMEQVMNDKDERIHELETQVHELSSAAQTPPVQDEQLLKLLQAREQEVSILEMRVQEILRERENQPERQSLTDSILDFEKRVEGLRRELVGKDSEINQLRQLIDIGAPSAPTPQVDPEENSLTLISDVVTLSPAPSPDLDEHQLLLTDLRALSHKFTELRECYHTLPDQVPVAYLRGSESVVQICMQQIHELRRSNDRYKRQVSELRRIIESVPDSKQRIALFDFEKNEFQHELCEDTHLLLTRLRDENEVLRARFLTNELSEADSPPVPLKQLEDRASSPRKTPSDKSLSNPPLAAGSRIDISSSNPPLPVAKQPDTRLGNPPVPEIKPSIPTTSLEQIAKRLKEETLVRRRIEEENEMLRITNGKIEDMESVRSELKTRDSELRSIRGKMLELKKDLQILEQEKEGHEIERRKMQRTIDNLRSAMKSPEETQQLTLDVARLQKELERARNRPKAVPMKPRAKKVFGMSTTAPVVLLGQSEVVKKLEQPSNELVLKLQTRLMETEEKLTRTERKLEVETQLELDLARMKQSQLEKEMINFRAENEDLKFQRKNDSMSLDLQLAVEESEYRLDAVVRESNMRAVEVVKLKSRMLGLEFDNTELVRRCERVEELRNILQSEVLRLKSLPAVAPVPVDPVHLDRIRTLEKQVAQQAEEFRVKDMSMLGEVQKLRDQREQDKQALAEAERVLGLIEQSEAKYLKVARENSKLRKEIAALNDDAFWNDLESLQVNHKEALDLLHAVEVWVKDPELRGKIRELISGS